VSADALHILLENLESVLQDCGDAVLNVKANLFKWRTALEKLEALPIEGVDHVTADLAALSFSGNVLHRSTKPRSSVSDPLGVSCFQMLLTRLYLSSNKTRHRSDDCGFGYSFLRLTPSVRSSGGHV